MAVLCAACRRAPAERAPIPSPEASRAEEIAVLDLAGYEVHPRSLTVRVGQTVRFRNSNSEDEVHSIRVSEVANGAQLFGVGNLPYGSSDHQFVRPGFYTVACDIHPMMRADILVTER